MSTGLGNGISSERKAATGGGGAPFPSNSADNGLSVDPVTGRIVLGTDGYPGSTLLNDRYIDTTGFFRVYIADTGAGQNHIELAAAEIVMSDDLNGHLLQSVCDANGARITLFQGPGGGSEAYILFGYAVPIPGAAFRLLNNGGNLELANIDTPAKRVIASNSDTLTTVIGDIGSQGNGVLFQVDDLNNQISGQADSVTLGAVNGNMDLSTTNGNIILAAFNGQMDLAAITINIQNNMSAPNVNTILLARDIVTGDVQQVPGFTGSRVIGAETYTWEAGVLVSVV